MFFTILSKDLKRNRTMNVILFIFFILTATFVSSGLSNVVTVLHGTDYYIDKAGVGDMLVITNHYDGSNGLDDLLDDSSYVKGYRSDTFIMAVFEGDTGKLLSDGSPVNIRSTSFIQSPKYSGIKVFNSDDEVVTQVEDGHMYVSGTFLEDNDLKAGDTLSLSVLGTELTLTVDGDIKDALCSSSMMSNARILISDRDMETLMANEQISESWLGRMYYIDTDDVTSLQSAVSEQTNILFAANKSTFHTLYIMHMIIAFIVLVMSICLIVIAFVLMKFTITLTLDEEFREIGVMKTIGLPSFAIRRMYIVKYLVMSSVASLIGLAAGVPFGNLMLSSATKCMVLGNDNMLLINILSCVLSNGVTVFCVYACTRRIKKATPLDAIRTGQTGERFAGKHGCSPSHSHMNVTGSLAINDIASRPGRYINIVLSFSICAVFMLMLMVTSATLYSSELISLVTKESDLYMSGIDIFSTVQTAQSTDDLEEKLEDIEECLAENGMPARVTIDLQYKYKGTAGGKSFMLNCSQGIGTKPSDFVYTEGTPPQNANEIAITNNYSELLGVGIGDTITIYFESGEKDCIVTAYYNSMNQVGDILRLNEEAPTDIGSVSAYLDYMIDFTDDATDSEIHERKERIKELYPECELWDKEQYCIESIRSKELLDGVTYPLLAITAAVVILVTVLMERSFIADEKSQIAILKAIGFSGRNIIRLHVKRFAIVSGAAIIAAICLALPATKLFITPIFRMMWSFSSIRYHVKFAECAGFLAGMWLLCVVTAYVTAGFTKNIDCRDTANIE